MGADSSVPQLRPAPQWVIKTSRLRRFYTYFLNILIVVVHTIANQEVLCEDFARKSAGDAMSYAPADNSNGTPELFRNAVCME